MSLHLFYCFIMTYRSCDVYFDIDYTSLLNIFVRYNCQLVSGDIFHILDMGPAPSPSTTTNTTNPTHSAHSTSPSVFTHLASHRIIAVSDTWGLVVTHPDILISPTKIAESCNCIRRGVLTDRIRSFGDISAPAVLGNLKHAFIEVHAH